jgi:hypothetical protein
VRDRSRRTAACCAWTKVSRSTSASWTGSGDQTHSVTGFPVLSGAGYRGDPDDLHSEILTGFLAAMRALDPDDLERVPLASRLCWAAWRAGQALACADARYTAARRDLPDSYDAPYMPWGHPDFVLATAVTRGILYPAQAQLIGRNPLEGVPLSQISAETGISHNVPCNRRKRAEKAITEAIGGGRLSDTASG